MMIIISGTAMGTGKAWYIARFLGIRVTGGPRRRAAAALAATRPAAVRHALGPTHARLAAGPRQESAREQLYKGRKSEEVVYVRLTYAAAFPRG